MASSGTYAFNPSYGDITLSAFERIQIRAPSLRQEHMLSAQKEINFLLSEQSNRQPNLWERNRTQTVLAVGVATLSLAVNLILITDASIVLNFGQQNESRRYITPISATEYMSYANQQTPGQPTVYWLFRGETPTVTFYPVPDSNGPYTFDYFWLTQMQDANLKSGQTADVPYRWLDCLVSGTAYRLARIYAPALEAQRKADYEQAWAIAAAQDIENVPLMLAPAIGSYYRR